MSDSFDFIATTESDEVALLLPAVQAAREASTGDGDVDGADFLVWRSNFGTGGAEGADVVVVDGRIITGETSDAWSGRHEIEYDIMIAL